eukprot:s4126_g1.t1
MPGDVITSVAQRTRMKENARKSTRSKKVLSPARTCSSSVSRRRQASASLTASRARSAALASSWDALCRPLSSEQEDFQLRAAKTRLLEQTLVLLHLYAVLDSKLRSRSGREGKQDRFYAIKLHLDLSALIIAAVLWSIPLHKAALFRDFMLKWERSEAWFGDWGIHQSVMVVVMVAHGWAAGLITREFSTVIRSILQTLALITVFLLGDPLRGNRDHFVSRSVPSWLLFVIVIMAAAASAPH